MLKRIKSLFLATIMLLALAPTAYARVEGNADDTYDLGGLITADDSGGIGYEKLGDKFKVPNGMFCVETSTANPDADHIYWSNMNGSSAAVQILAEGGSACKSFTFKDLGISSYLSEHAFSFLALVFKDNWGNTIDSVDLGGCAGIPTDYVKTLSELYGCSEWNVQGVSSIEISYQLDNPIAADLSFETIKIADVSNENYFAEMPTILSQPMGVAVNPGDPVNLSVDASVLSGELSYQWYSNTTNSDTDASVISGATASTCSFNAAALGTVYYYCVVTNTDTNVIITTASAASDIVAVSTNELDNAETPTILEQPQNGIATQGDETSLSVTASVITGTLSYQWYINTVDNASGGSLISGATSATYSFVPSAVGSKYYYCEITNTDPSASGNTTAKAISSTARLTVTYADETYDFSGLGSADSAGEGYQRIGDKFKAPNEMFSAGASAASEDISAVYHNNYSDTSTTVTLLTEGEHTCKTFTFHDLGLSSEEQTLQFTSLQLVFRDYNEQLISTLDLGASGVIPDDGIINMSTLYSLPEWSIEGVNSIEISFGLDHFVSSLNFENIKMSNISITNANAHLPLIISQPTDKTVLVNAAVNLSVTASVSSGTLSYQWYSSNENSNTGGIPISGETLASYSAPTTAVGMMYYYCVVTNTDPDATISTTATTVTNAVAVTVNEPVDAQTPNIDTQPVEQTVVIGASTNLSVAASVSIGTLSYQWYSNDENSTTGGLSISGETLASYSVPTTATGTTYYYCAVTNTDPDATGSATASAITNAVAITVTAAQPVISPTSASYDLNAPADVSTSITWGSADAVTGVVRNLSALTNNTDYTVSGDTLTIKDSYLSSLTLSEDDTEEFEISFDMGDPVSFIVTAVTSYIPGSDATLSDLTVGGSTVDGFEAGTNAYDVELPYGTLSGSVPATIGAVPNDSMASVSITQAVLPGDATVQVTAEDGETQQTYTVNFTLEAAPNTVPSLKSGVSATAAASTTVDTAYMLDLSTIFEDADEDPLTYTVQIDGASVQEADADYSYTPALAGITTLLFAANDGIEDSSDTYTISLTVTELPIPTYVLTITAGTGGRITAGSSGDYSPGTVINIQASSNSIYRFNKWTTSDGGAFANASSPTTTFTMPANATTIRAGFIHTGGSGRNNDDDDSSSDTYLPDERIIESNDQVSVNLIRGRTVLSADQIDTLILQNRTKPVVLTGNGYTLTFPVGSLSTARGGRDYRLGISFNSGSRYEAIKTLAGAGIVTMLDFDHSGALPGRAIVRFYAGSSYAGKTLYYYYYNPTTQAFEYRQSAVVDRGGYVTITQTYCSEYVLSSEVLTDKKPGIPETGAAHEPMTCAIPDVVPALIGKQKKRLFLDNKPENDGE